MLLLHFEQAFPLTARWAFSYRVPDASADVLRDAEANLEYRTQGKEGVFPVCPGRAVAVSV